MRKIILILAAFLLCSPAAAQVPMTGAGLGVSSAGGGGPTKAYIGNQFTENAPAGTTQTFSMNVGTASADRLIVITVNSNLNTTISSVTVDPAGANVTLTQDAFVNNASGLAGIYSGLVTSGSGTKNIQVVFASNPQFDFIGLQLWNLKGLVSNLMRTSAAQATSLPMSISVTSGYFLLSGSEFTQATGVNYSTSTQVPDNNYVFGTSNFFCRSRLDHCFNQCFIFCHPKSGHCERASSSDVPLTCWGFRAEHSSSDLQSVRCSVQR